MKSRVMILIAIIGCVLFGLAAGIRFVAANVPGEATVPDPLPRRETLYIAGIYWGNPANFNPLDGNSAWPASGNIFLIYESLFAYNQLTNDLDPLLAESYEFSPDNTIITVTLQAGTLWQDDVPLTPEDVVYTYELANTQPDIPYGALFNYIDEIEATGARSLRITLNESQLNPGVVKNFLATIKILPMHIWQPREASGPLWEYAETHPLGSGPYSLLNFSPGSINLFRDDNYWGEAVFGLPAPKYVVHRIYATNDEILQAFKSGDVDMSQSYIPEIWKLWEEQGLRIGTWYDQPPYQLAGSIPILLINTTKPGLDNPLVRRALAYSIDYNAISMAVWGISQQVSSSLILPVGGESALFNPEQVDLYGWEYDPAEAENILINQLGATLGDDGIYVLPDSTRLGPWSARCPNGWTDWQVAITETVQNALDAGIDLYTDFPDWSWDYYMDLQLGDFDLAMLWIASGTPSALWERYQFILDPRDVPPVGEYANWNFGRFIDPAVGPLLDQAGQVLDPISVEAVYDQLDRIFMENVVDIPMMYRPQEFYEFNWSNWMNFPTAENPTAPPMFSGAGVEVLYQISPYPRLFLPYLIR